MVVLLLGSISLTALNIRPVKGEWTGTVYILADGSIDPPDAPITTRDKVTYTLTGNITSSGNGIIVERDNIILDGNGYTIQGEHTPDSAGISLYGRRNVTIQNMNIKNFYYGIMLDYSSNNVVYHNNFVNNGLQVYILGAYFNVWDCGYPGGGNYWSDYTGVDYYSGPNQDQAGSDGIGDTPYVIDAYNVDNYPLMRPFTLLNWSLVVAVYDWDGVGAALAGGDTWVELIRHGEVSGVTRHIDEHSRAVFYNVEPGTYYVNVWHRPVESVSFWEFWAQKTGITVEAGKSTTVEVTRNKPVITGFTVQQAPAKIGDPTTITVTVKNIDSTEQWVKTKLIIKNETGVWVYQKETASQKLQPGEETTFTFNDFSPANEGSYYGYAICNIIGGGSQTTDQEGWKHLFTIAPSEFILNVPYQSQDGTAWCAVTSLAMVLRYYGNYIHSWDIAMAMQLSNEEGVHLGPGLAKNLYNYVKNNYPEFMIRLGKYGVKTTQILEDIKGNLTLGYPVILSLKSVDDGKEVYHAIVVVGYNETSFFVHDPGDFLKWRSSPINFYISNGELYELIDIHPTGTMLMFKCTIFPLEVYLYAKTETW